MSSITKREYLTFKVFGNMMKLCQEYLSLKQTSAKLKGGQNRHLLPVIFQGYNLDKPLCVVELLEASIKRAASLRKETISNS